MKRFDVESSEKYCIFQSGASRYCVPALAVRHVSARPALAPVPLSHPVLRGIGHLHNEFLPVFSLQALAGHCTDDADGVEQQMIVINDAQGGWGLLVDKVCGLAPLEISLSPRNKLDNNWSAVLVGTASHLDTILQVLDPHYLYRLAQTNLEEFWEQDSAQVVPPADAELSVQVAAET